MIEWPDDRRDGQIIIDGTPRLIISGEVHYFRLARREWAGRLTALRDTGCTAAASYIPWLWHELPDGTIDVTGATRPERDLAAFIDLCHDLGLWFIARPGPFVMAELKNEGLPYRLYTEHPEIIPPTWDGRPVRPSPRACNPTAATSSPSSSTTRPACSPGSPTALTGPTPPSPPSWTSSATATATPCPAATPLDLTDPAAWAQAVRTPQETWAAALRTDLGAFNRTRLARYLTTLRGYAEAAGVREVPFAINVHGTAGGDGAPFPIGISQLHPAYRAVPGVIAGSDHWSTAEITAVGERTVTFTAPTSCHTATVTATGTTITASTGCDLHRDGPHVTVTARRPGPFTLTLT